MMKEKKPKSNYSNNDTLVVVAHPDDEVLGCGGYMLENYNRGGRNYVLYLNNGYIRSNYSSADIESQIQKTAKILQFNPIIEKLEASLFDTYPQRTVNDLVTQYIKLIKPRTVITHIANDLHQDHRVVNTATMVACRYTNGSSVKNLIEMPVISSSEINPQFSFTPNFFVDITPHIEAKKKAMEQYVFEAEAMKELRGERGIHGWGIFYGMHIGVMYAEAFKLVRGVL